MDRPTLLGDGGYGFVRLASSKQVNSMYCRFADLKL
jgi:hypothetical protein